MNELERLNRLLGAASTRSALGWAGPEYEKLYGVLRANDRTWGAGGAAEQLFGTRLGSIPSHRLEEIVGKVGLDLARTKVWDGLKLAGLGADKIGSLAANTRLDGSASMFGRPDLAAMIGESSLSKVRSLSFAEEQFASLSRVGHWAGGIGGLKSKEMERLLGVGRAPLDQLGQLTQIAHGLGRFSSTFGSESAFAWRMAQRRIAAIKALMHDRGYAGKAVPVSRHVPALPTACAGARFRYTLPAIYMCAMSHPPTAQPQKAETARRQLGTALHLWLADLDPVSVHVLASGGCEVAEGLAKQVGKTFSAFALEVHPDMSESQLWKLRNTYWNAMKHVTGRDGKDRDDEELLTTSLENDNQALLCAGWYDLMQVIPAPIEAQALVVWYMTKHSHTDEYQERFDELFPDLLSVDAAGQKAMLRAKIYELRDIDELMNNPLVDTRPLIVSA